MITKISAFTSHVAGWICVERSYVETERGSMLTKRQAAAEIRAILVTDNRDVMRRMMRDFETSDFVYYVRPIYEAFALLGRIKDVFGAFATDTPTLLIIDYRTAGMQCDAILTHVRALSQQIAVECVVTHGPVDTKRRQRLESLDATLLDTEFERFSCRRESTLGLTLH